MRRRFFLVALGPGLRTLVISIFGLPRVSLTYNFFSTMQKILKRPRHDRALYIFYDISLGKPILRKLVDVSEGWDFLLRTGGGDEQVPSP